MKITLQELRDFVRRTVLEEAKKGKKKDDPKKDLNASTKAYGQHAEAYDFSKPLGNMNLYRLQGGSNFGPYTNAAGSIDPTGLTEQAPEAAGVVAKINEALSESVWTPVYEASRPAENVWEELIRLESTSARSSKVESGKKK